MGAATASELEMMIIAIALTIETRVRMSSERADDHARLGEEITEGTSSFKKS